MGERQISREFYSPLRYPGGKGKVASYFKNIIKENLLYDGIYVEPYAGGASVGLSLLFNEYVSKIIINDIDRSIYAFWYCVLNRTEELCLLIEKTPVTIEVWKTQKEIQKEKTHCDALKLGFSTFFLNRTNRSGILNAGPIGGMKQKGKWKLNARYNKDELISRIRRIAEYKDRIKIYNSDALVLIRHLRKRLPANTLFYLDPPYYVKGKDLYLNYYTDEDHKRIAEEVQKITKQKWVVSYDNVRFIRKIYQDSKQTKYHLAYSACTIGKGEEIMIFSDALYIGKSIKKFLADA